MPPDEGGQFSSVVDGRRVGSARGSAEPLRLRCVKPRRRTTDDTTGARRRAIELYYSGMSLHEVGQELEVSRERVRQYLVDAEVHTRHNGWRIRACPLAVMKAIRARGVESFNQAVAQSPELSRWTVSRAVRALGCEDAVRRLFRMRMRARLRGDLARVAGVLGRTPTTGDMNAGRGGLCVSATYQRVFGSVSAAQVASGLRPWRSGRSN